MERLKSLIQTALQMDHFTLSQAMQLQVAHNSDSIVAIKDDTSAVRKTTAALTSDAQELKMTSRFIESEALSQRSKAICNWLSDDDHSAQQKDYLDRRQGKTGEWLLSSDEFSAWLNGAPSVLLCKGGPGTGKTMLAAIVVDHLQRTLLSANTDAALAFLYCNYKRQNEQTVDRLFRSLLRQLVDRRPDMPTEVTDIYRRWETHDIQSSIEEVKTALGATASSFDRVYCVVDALDELEESVRAVLISGLQSLQSCAAVSILFTARSLPGIERAVKPDHRRDIRASEADVRAFVRGHMGDLSSCVRRSEELQEEVISAIARTANGMSVSPTSACSGSPFVNLMILTLVGSC